MFCQQCGAENRVNAKFCAHCGAPLESSPESENSYQNVQQVPQKAPFQSQQSVEYSQPMQAKPTINSRHWTVTVALVIWILAILSNLYSTAIEFAFHYNPGIGIGVILTLLSFFTAYNMYDADREGLYTGIIAIIIAFVWDIIVSNYYSVGVVIVIVIFTILAAPHLVKGGIKKPAPQ